MKKSLHLLLCAAGIIGLTACATSNDQPKYVARGTSAQDRPIRTIFLDDNLGGSLAVDRVTLQRDRDNRLTVKAAIRNLTSKDYTVQAQAIFRNQDGSLDTTAWEAVTLTDHQETYFTTKSMTPRVEDTVTVQFRAMARRGALR
ncbi:MAG: hypothetical protein SGI71_08860 [Verrucomicrobiota bacterium]|nr:hypothetical protein [Verrucomicrobiota bacterium]